LSIRIKADSKETVRVPVRAREAGVDVNPTTFTVAIAFTGLNTDPVAGDWKAAAWETDGAIYKARIVVGPGGAVTLVKSRIYKAWVRITTPTETPIIPAGQVIVE
jgi:hypothetical protein